MRRKSCGSRWQCTHPSITTNIYTCQVRTSRFTRGERRAFGASLARRGRLSQLVGNRAKLGNFLFMRMQNNERSIFKTFFWGSNVHWRQRTDKPCEEVEPERIEPKVCCPSESLLMGHGGPLIPLGLFLSLPQKDSLVLLQIPPWGSEIVSSEGVFTDAGLQEAAGCPEESWYSSLDYGAGGEYHGWPSGPLKELQASVVLWPAATFSIFWRWRITTPRKLTVRAELTATGASW